MHLTSPPSAALHTVKLPLCINSKVCFGVLLMYFLEMHHRNFMLISRWRPSFLAPFPLALSPSHRPSLSLSLLLSFSQLVDELLHEGQPISVGLSAETGRGGQWLAHIAQLLKRGSVTDVTLVPVGISYDRVPDTRTQVDARSVIHKWHAAFGSKGDKGSVEVLHHHL